MDDLRYLISATEDTAIRDCIAQSEVQLTHVIVLNDKPEPVVCQIYYVDDDYVDVMYFDKELEGILVSRIKSIYHLVKGM